MSVVGCPTSGQYAVSLASLAYEADRFDMLREFKLLDTRSLDRVFCLFFSHFTDICPIKALIFHTLSL